MNEKIYQSVTTEAFQEYKTKIMITEGGYLRVTQYKDRQRKKKSGFEEICSHNLEFQNLLEQVNEKQSKGRQSADSKGDKEFDMRHLNRTRDTLIAYVAMNRYDWRSFITLTFKENITDLTEANKAFHIWVTAMKRAFPKFLYIGVPEFQKRGAVHYHILTNLECGVDIPRAKEPIRTYNEEKKRWFEIEYHSIPYWTRGFSSAFDLNMADDKFNVALYLTKYLYKDIDDRLWGRNKILKSNSLKKPDIYYLAKDETFLDAYYYLIEHGYELSTYEFIATMPFQSDMQVTTAHMVKKEDVSKLAEILKADNGYKTLL